MLAAPTYTDAVIYDLENNRTLCKSKSLTTKWDFTIGISKALAQLDPEQIKQVEPGCFIHDPCDQRYC